MKVLVFFLYGLLILISLFGFDDVFIVLGTWLLIAAFCCVELKIPKKKKRKKRRRRIRRTLDYTTRRV